MLVPVPSAGWRRLEPSSTESVLNLHQDDGISKKVPTTRAKATLLSVIKEMGEPRLAESARKEVIGTEEPRPMAPAERPALSHAKRH